MPPELKIAGVLLAGGLARRMGGGDKCLRLLAGQPLLRHVVRRVAPQVSALALNANGDPARFSAFDLPVLADSLSGNLGPLAGVLTVHPSPGSYPPAWKARYRVELAVEGGR